MDAQLILQFFEDPFNVALLILFLPLASFIILFLFADHMPGKGDWLGTSFSALAFLLSLYLFLNVWNIEVVLVQIPWFVVEGTSSQVFTLSMKVHDFSAIMLLLVSFISFLVHLYSLAYMKGKRHYMRYYPYLGLFTFSMTGIVLSDNLLVTFMFWELVGFSSYLLIGFWYEKGEAMHAAKKAFLFNRIGDTGFIIALIALYSVFGTFEISFIQEAFASQSSGQHIFFWIGLGLFIGCMGKSAQFPLQAWLPDAMEGPTPVSALIHAATMVAAGIYLLVKLYFLLNDEVLTIIACTGAITAFTGALPALFQTDIKKVLAFSTISQLGLMMVAIGVNVPQAAFFHLITHGFFKAGLFLSAGSVIHSMHEAKHYLFVKGQYRDFDSQDMRLMGGFRKIAPLTFYSFMITAASLVGLPLFSGFLSKDAILQGTLDWSARQPVFFYLIPVLAFATVFITAVYMTRQICLIFFGENRLTGYYPSVKNLFEEIKHISLPINIPLVILSILSLWFFYSLNPFNAANGFIFRAEEHGTVAVLAVLLSASGILAGIFSYRKKSFSMEAGKAAGFAGLLKNNWYLDRIYYHLLIQPGFKVAALCARADARIIDGIIHFFGVLTVVLAHIIAWVDKALVDGIVNLSARIAAKGGKTVRKIQGGRVQGYFLFALLMIFCLFIWIIIGE